MGGGGDAKLSQFEKSNIADVVRMEQSNLPIYKNKIIFVETLSI